ncbi:hypothetical protein GCM10009792_10460 [Microcella alkalica]
MSTQVASAEAVAVYRFWSDTFQSHFYTLDVAERDSVIANYPKSVWQYEGAKFGAYQSQVAGTIPVYRFWSQVHNAHYYTASEDEKNHVIAAYPVDVWQYERVAFYAYGTQDALAQTQVMAQFWSPTFWNHFYSSDPAEIDKVKAVYPAHIWTFEGDAFRVPISYAPAAPLPPSGQVASDQAAAVYRFWSDTFQSHFYTLDVAERDSVIANYPKSVWQYEGAKFGAYQSQVAGTIPVYRFWSQVHNAHYYTASEDEKNHVIAAYPVDVWQYERVAFYAYGTQDALAQTQVMAQFWSPTFWNHFYSSDPAEIDKVKAVYPAHIWTFEGDAFRVPISYAPAAPLPTGGLSTVLAATLGGLSGKYSVSVRDLGGTRSTVDIGGETMQEPVSVIKVFVAYAVLDRVDLGRLTLATRTRSGVTVQDCLRVIIQVSDNYCHWDLVALVGEQALNDQFWAEGYRGTVYAGRSGGGTYYPAKLSTTDDLALLLSRLYRGELLSPAMSEHLIALLETQYWRSKLPSGVAAGVPVGNKTGSAWTADGWFHSDAGVVSSVGGTYAIAVLGSRGATAAGVRAIGRVVYEHYNGPIATAASYSSLNAVTAAPTTFYRHASTSAPLGTIPAGVRLEVYASARTWYQVVYNGRYVYVRMSALLDAIAYPRSAR